MGALVSSLQFRRAFWPEQGNPAEKEMNLTTGVERAAQRCVSCLDSQSSHCGVKVCGTAWRHLSEGQGNTKSLRRCLSGLACGQRHTDKSRKVGLDKDALPDLAAEKLICHLKNKNFA